MEGRESFLQAVQALPTKFRQAAERIPAAEQSRVEELRLRVGQPMTAVTGQQERNVGGEIVTTQALAQMIELASRASVHAVWEQLRRGYLTVEGGHRIGLCGTAVMRDGEVHALRALSSANLRIARQVTGAARPILETVCPGGRLVSTLVVAPPGFGKTTLLRDLIRLVSEGEGCAALRVSVADERGELAALFGGRPQLDVGRRTDVMEGCPKAQAMMYLLRAMNPQVLAMDEITAPEDVGALLTGAGCGVSLMATAHGNGQEDLRRRPLYRPLLEEHIFQKVVRIRREAEKFAYEVEEGAV
jgi:stage III sporulation protein AA